MSSLRLPLVLGALAVATTFSVGKAEAGRFRGGFHGGVHWSGSVGVHYSSPSVNVGFHYASRPSWRPRTWGVRGSVYVGPSFYYRPYYYYGYYDYGYVPSYYGSSYYPVEAAPQQYAGPSASAAVIAPARPELPKLGLGLFAGGSSVSNQNTGDSNANASDVGLLGRFRITDGLIVEGEIGKDSYQQNLRVDRRLGASLLYEFGAYNRLAPYVLGGIGVQEAQTDGQYNTKQNFAELGGGLRYAITPHFHLTADVRFGSRDTTSSDMAQLGGATAKVTSAPPPANAQDTTEKYTRGRLAAVLYF